MLVSTFELLLKDITPTEGSISDSGRKILQGYFLTIANTTDTTLRLRLLFTATTPSINLADTIFITDVTGGNSFGDLTATSNPNQFRFDISVPPNDTALVILQPDITVLDPATRTVETRGYVEISTLNLTKQPITFNVLLTPEHRGTFLPNDFIFGKDADNKGKDFDQLISTLPTATGSSLYQLESQTFKVKENLKEEIDKLIEIPPDKIREIPDKTIREIPSPINPEIANIQQSLGLMAETIDGIQENLAQGQAFISPDERPNLDLDS